MEAHSYACSHLTPNSTWYVQCGLLDWLCGQKYADVQPPFNSEFGVHRPTRWTDNQMIFYSAWRTWKASSLWNQFRLSRRMKARKRHRSSEPETRSCRPLSCPRSGSCTCSRSWDRQLCRNSPCLANRRPCFLSGKDGTVSSIHWRFVNGGALHWVYFLDPRFDVDSDFREEADAAVAKITAHARFCWHRCLWFNDNYHDLPCCLSIQK